MIHSLRYIDRNGKMVLQMQETYRRPSLDGSYDALTDWKDVPLPSIITTDRLKEREHQMKAMLTFDLDLPQDRRAHKRAINAPYAFNALTEIANQIFQPARKHGYSYEYKQNEQLNKLLENQQVVEAIGLLEDIFYEIVNDLGVNPHCE